MDIPLVNEVFRSSTCSQAVFATWTFSLAFLEETMSRAECEKALTTSIFSNNIFYK
jgi:hypothetical protein